MYWLDVAIIYFAFGAPFGVFQITAKRELTVPAFFRIASGYLLWPLTAIQSTARFLFTKPAAQIPQTNVLDAIRTEIERALFANTSTTDIYAFREVFYRYTGLAAAIAEFNSSHVTRHLSLSSSLITHSPSLTRSACISRRDRQKLDMQFRAARQDFAEILGATNNKIDWTVEALAECTGDRALINAIYSR